MRYLALVVVTAVITGCGEAKPNATPSDPPSAQPTVPKPTARGAETRPPPAWLETAEGRVSLGYSSYCWHTERSGVCADSAAPSCADPAYTPKITLRRGEVVIAHIGFEPAEVALSFFPAEGPPTAADQRTLEPSRTPSWAAERDGPFSLFVRAKAGGDASYVACVVFSDAAPDIDAAKRFVRFPLYWVGERFESWPLETIEGLDGVGDAVTFIYGDCTPHGDDQPSCTPPLEIQVFPLCLHLDVVAAAPIWRTRRVRGAPLGTIDSAPVLFTRASQVKVYRGEGSDAGAALRALKELRSLNRVPPVIGSSDPIPAPAPGVLEGARPCA